jgi:hypothetical protein
MSFLDKLVGGGRLHDCGQYRSRLTGTLVKSPAPFVGPDGVLSAWLLPDDKSVLKNRNGRDNVNGLVELKVGVVEKARVAVGETLKALAGAKVTVFGVQVNNDASDGKVELHPTDLIAGPLPEDRAPAWVGEIRKNIKDPANSTVYRVLAASDASPHKPPQADDTRPVQVSFPYPPPTEVPRQKFAFEIRPAHNERTDFQLNDDMMKKALDLLVTVASRKKEGPGAFVADVFLFWSEETKNLR